MARSRRDSVTARAADRCEYCHLPQFASTATFHIEHVVAQQHGHPLSDDISNLALACNRCNLHKGTNLTSLDPETAQLATIFNPRTESWSDHFQLVGAKILGSSATGRATVRLLHMNDPVRVERRASLIRRGVSFT